MARVVVTLDEPLATEDGRMAGLQVRVHEMAGALARAGHEVLVAAPGRAGLDVPYRLVAPAALAALGHVDVCIAPPRMVAGLCADVGALVVDGYESPFGSFLSQAAALLPRIGERAVHDYRATMARHLAAYARADRILCANERQRISFLTILSMLGSIGPRTPGTDVVVCVRSGASAAPPERPRDASPHEPVLLWGGGCYPWFDVETFLAALPAIVVAVPTIRLRFAGIDGVGTGELPLARRIREAIAAAPELARRAEFVDWYPYAARGALYAGADVGVCTYGDHLETTLSMRTRVIDMIWGGLPLVVTAGDEMSDVVDAHELGCVVQPDDAPALAAAVSSLLGDRAARSRASAAARALALGELSWDRQVKPLSAFCDDVAAGRVVRRPAPAPAEVIARLNDGPGRRTGDVLRRLAARARRAWTVARTDGMGTVLRKVSA